MLFVRGEGEGVGEGEVRAGFKGLGIVNWEIGVMDVLLKSFWNGESEKSGIVIPP